MSAAAQTANEIGDWSSGTKVEAGVHGRANSASMNFGFAASQLRFCSAIVCYTLEDRAKNLWVADWEVLPVSASEHAAQSNAICRSDDQMLNLWETA